MIEAGDHFPSPPIRLELKIDPARRLRLGIALAVSWSYSGLKLTSSASGGGFANNFGVS
ncbi:hypothetical protein QA641_30280 [Bradyrhizobium sp. CB1650]|uniref:hypothetical protein n=1 Tax=Bradyrhizobium sp. CB1650 TaxID=3039153 RepID=UPI00243573D0|nr:hypothetical protein [Bradyrhizobium sp. CB1650]WGD49902.1 hypothetical protein QA641_30280 [Bradyrhizobium sp. CB1650]